MHALANRAPFETVAMNRVTPSHIRLVSANEMPVPVGTVDKIDEYVRTGHQKDLADFFSTWPAIPNRIDDWEIRVNEKKRNDVVVGHNVVALPLGTRSRILFREGCLLTLKEAGFDDTDARHYYKYAWKRRYVWVDTVVTAVKEMIDAFQSTSVLDSYEAAADPRYLARSVKVPINPYCNSQQHFLIAVSMAKSVIRARSHQSDASLTQEDDFVSL